MVARASLTAFSRLHLERVLTASQPPGRLGRIPLAPDVLVPQENRIVTLCGGGEFGFTLRLTRTLGNEPGMRESTHRVMGHRRFAVPGSIKTGRSA